MSCAPQPTAAAAAGAQEKDPGFPWIRTGTQPSPASQLRADRQAAIPSQLAARTVKLRDVFGRI